MKIVNTIIKRDGSIQEFRPSQITEVINKAAKNTNPNKPLSKKELQEVLEVVLELLAKEEGEISVEMVQNAVEVSLMKLEYYDIAKHFVLYRTKKEDIRKNIQSIATIVGDRGLKSILKKSFDSQGLDYMPSKLADKFDSFLKPNMPTNEKMTMLIRAAAELTSQEEPNWEYISGNLFAYKVQKEADLNWVNTYGYIPVYSEKVESLVKQGLYGEYLIENYSADELRKASSFIKKDRDNLLTFSGLDLLYSRYLTRTGNKVLLETPQEMFLGIALHLHMDEDREKRMDYVKDHYDVLSKLQLTMATPTMANARKPFHQLSSCFIETVEDSLDGIYRATTNFADVSKHGGGMGRPRITCPCKTLLTQIKVVW